MAFNSLRVLVAAILISAMAVVPAAAQDAWPSYGVMKLEDHKAYFQPGAYLSYLDEFDITRRDVLLDVQWEETHGQTVVTQTWSSLSVSENHLVDDPKPFAKMLFKPQPSPSTWQAFRSGFSYSVSEREVFDGEAETRVWLSDNDDLTIQPDDVEWGSETEYFDAAFQQTEGACCMSREDYAKIAIGDHVTNCSFVAHKTWEVMCISRHVASGYTWRTFVTRLEDAIG
ncbi:MAG: hypothetical protein WA989_02390 [Henriciella sp.]|uniref:hypothetical protein n=1 Tax=Henriciella sp. TaxID=1968823 RepID=UPI003C716660